MDVALSMMREGIELLVFNSNERPKLLGTSLEALADVVTCRKTIVALELYDGEVVLLRSAEDDVGDVGC